MLTEHHKRETTQEREGRTIVKQLFFKTYIIYKCIFNDI